MGRLRKNPRLCRGMLINSGGQRGIWNVQVILQSNRLSIIALKLGISRTNSSGHLCEYRYRSVLMMLTIFITLRLRTVYNTETILVSGKII